MASSIGNTHVLKRSEWDAIKRGENGPWALVVSDQAKMHKNGGPLRVFVVPDDAEPGAPRYDVTGDVERMTA